MQISDDDLNEIRRQMGFSQDQIVQLIQDSLDTQRIIAPVFKQVQTLVSGGTNMCPNSDFAFSITAATVPGTLPGDAGDDNNRVYRVTRQVREADISSDHLAIAALEANPWVPCWDRVLGVAEIGAESGHDQYDIAFEFTNNWLVSGRRWYIRLALATLNDTPLPEGSKIFAGFWVKRSGPSEGWVEGGNFTMSYKVFGLPGTKHVRYKVIAKTDTGVSLESQLLDVTDAPDTLDQDNYIQIKYPAAAGFIEFELYREDVASGEIRQIVRVRDSSQLVAYDTGQSGRLETNGFPAVTLSQFRAYAECPIDAVSIDVSKTFHNLAIKVPSNFDTSDVLQTYLRIGVISPTTIDRQVQVDTVWASETNNSWSPSPFDVYPSIPSTSMTTGSPTSGGGVGDPPGDGGGHPCVWDQHDLLLPHQGWLRLEEGVAGLKLDNGLSGSCNVAEDFHGADVSQYMLVEFDCGLVILANFMHRFIRSFTDYSGVMVQVLKVGDKLQGGCHSKHMLIKVRRLQIVNLPEGEFLRIRSAKISPSCANQFYAVGDRETGYYVYSHNNKELEVS